MKTSWLLIAALLLVLAVPTALLAQIDMVNGTDVQTDWRIGAYADDENGNMAWTREYDGRDLDGLGLDLDTYGYGGEYQYWFEARDLFIGDESADFALSHRNEWGLELSTDLLTHRLDRFPPINPYLAPFGMSAIVAGAPVGDAFIDLTPGEETDMNRRLNAANIRLFPGNNQDVALVFGWWNEIEKGSRQYRFRARAATPGVIGNRQRAAADIPIDRTTDEATLGADFGLGRYSALNYRLSVAQYNDEGTRPGGVLATVVPLNALTTFDSTQTSNIFRARTKLGSRLYFTGAHTNRTRENDTASVPGPVAIEFVDPGTFLNSEVKIESTNLALTYLPTTALSLTGRWRKYDLDNRVPPVFRLIDGVPGDTPENMSLSRDVESMEIEGTFSGIRRLFLRAGFENRETDREISAIHPPHNGDDEGFEHPFTSESTEADILKFGFRYNPTWTLSFSGKFEDWNVDDPAFAGSATDRKIVDLNATYMVRNNLALYGNFNRLDEDNDEVRVPIDDIPTITDPTQPIPPDYQAIRNLAAGQGYDNKFTTWALGAWYGLSDKLSLDAQFGSVETESGALWVLGVDSTFLPNLPPDLVPFQADSSMWSLGATYTLTPRWQVYGRFRSMDADGRQIVDIIPGDPALPLDWQPIDVNEDRWTLGVGYQLSPRHRLQLDYSLSDWEDTIDPANNGDFNTWRIAWSTGF